MNPGYLSSLTLEAVKDRRVKSEELSGWLILTFKNDFFFSEFSQQARCSFFK
jgi:hypothetical protein